MNPHMHARAIIQQWLKSRFPSADIENLWLDARFMALFVVRPDSPRLELGVSDEALSDHTPETIVGALTALKADAVLREPRGQRLLLNSHLQLEVAEAA